MTEREAKIKKENLKPQSNYLVITFGYSSKVVLPFESGLIVLRALEMAEEVEINSSGVRRVSPVNASSGSKIEASLMSHEDYMKGKLAHLLELNAKDY